MKITKTEVIVASLFWLVLGVSVYNDHGEKSCTAKASTFKSITITDHSNVVYTKSKVRDIAVEDWDSVNKYRIITESGIDTVYTNGTVIIREDGGNNEN